MHDGNGTSLAKFLFFWRPTKVLVLGWCLERISQFGNLVTQVILKFRIVATGHNFHRQRLPSSH
jgi:hypothetical protein